MAVKSKVQLASDIAASTFTAPQQVILDDMVDSYEDIFPQLTTVQRDALTPTNGQIVYNTDTDTYQYWNGVSWFGIGQDLSTPLVVKIDLSSADILAIDTTDILVASAPGAGYAIIPTSMVYRFTYGSTQYASGGGTQNINLMHSTKTMSSSNVYGIVSGDAIKAASDRSGVSLPTTGSSSTALVENDSLVLRANQAFTTGDGTLTVWVTYSLITW